MLFMSVYIYRHFIERGYLRVIDCHIS